MKLAPAPSLPPAAQAAAPEAVSPLPDAAPVASDDTKPNVTPPADVAPSPPAAKVSTAKSSKPKAPPPAPAPAGGHAPAARATAPLRASVAAAAPVAQPPKAALNFQTLVERLRNTSSIGVFTKLSVKNQVDDLLGDFRGFYAGKVPPTLDDLHERYDGLVLKVITLVQNGDASLASAISSSRGAIWERLSNRESFEAI